MKIEGPHICVTDIALPISKESDFLWSFGTVMLAIAAIEPEFFKGLD